MKRYPCDANACLDLAEMYMDGKYLPQCYDEAFKFLLYASEQGNVEAMPIMKLLLEEGLVTEMPIEEPYYLKLTLINPN